MNGAAVVCSLFLCGFVLFFVLVGVCLKGGGAVLMNFRADSEIVGRGGMQQLGEVCGGWMWMRVVGRSKGSQVVESKSSEGAGESERRVQQTSDKEIRQRGWLTSSRSKEEGDRMKEKGKRKKDKEQKKAMAELAFI